MTRIAKACRICGNTALLPVFSLGDQFLTGVFPRSRDETVTRGPVDLVRCDSSHGCGLVQLRQSYDLSEMYGMNYGYRSGLNPSMVRHLQAKVAGILRRDLLRPGDVVVDIGSNDATTLRSYPQGVYELLGVDPTGTKFAEFYPDTVKLIPDFFSAARLREVLGERRAKVVTSFSMFYDLEEPITFAREVQSSLDRHGIWVFEQSYLPSMLRTNSFDTICHEHLEFYALKQIMWIAREAGLKVVDVELNDVNGGSFSITAARGDSPVPVNEAAVSAILAEEERLGIDREATYEDFRSRVDTQCRNLVEFLESARRDGKTVCGLGASTKGNVLLQYCGIDSKLLRVIGEVNEDKFGAFTPGTLIPMVPEDQMLGTNPDYILVLPWHFRGFFQALPKLRGRRLVYPLPQLEVVTP